MDRDRRLPPVPLLLLLLLLPCSEASYRDPRGRPGIFESTEGIALFVGVLVIGLLCIIGQMCCNADGSTSSSSSRSKDTREYTQASTSSSPPPEPPQAGLHNAAMKGDVDTVNDILNSGLIGGSGPDIDQKNALGETALYLASREGKLDMVMTLILRGANTELRSRGGLTALDIAQARHQGEVVEFLQITTGSHPANLLEAAREGDTEAVTRILNSGADIDQRTETGQTALYLASKEGRLEVVRLLLARGASALLATEDGFTALDVARQNHREDVVTLLQTATLAAGYTTQAPVAPGYNTQPPLAPGYHIEAPPVLPSYTQAMDSV